MLELSSSSVKTIEVTKGNGVVDVLLGNGTIIVVINAIDSVIYPSLSTRLSEFAGSSTCRLKISCSSSMIGTESLTAILHE